MGRGVNRKDFDTLARALKYAPHHVRVGIAARDNIAIYLARTLETNFANFDKEKFLKACGFKEETL